LISVLNRSSLNGHLPGTRGQIISILYPAFSSGLLSLVLKFSPTFLYSHKWERGAGTNAGSNIQRFSKAH
jgi:hypothetical protein